MKKTLCFILILLSLSFSSCVGISVGSFSWDDVRSSYAAGGAGVMREGFYNVIENRIKNADDALRLAQNEHVPRPDESYSAAYDADADMWRVSFFPKDKNVAGGCGDVYINGNGVTELTVSGE